MDALRSARKHSPPLPSRTNWTRLVPRPVLSGRVSSGARDVTGRRAWEAELLAALGLLPPAPEDKHPVARRLSEVTPISQY